jgi:RimJ/RimL family protein N-acetyltransferase
MRLRPPRPSPDDPIVTPRLVLRRYRRGDEGDLRRVADDPRVAEHLRDGFPSPYTRDDAAEWVAASRDAPPLTVLAITRDDGVIGGIGLLPGTDVYRFGAEVGYWLGVDHWGRGYATEALRAFCERVFAATALERLFAHVFAGNDASRRVLEKSGFTHESIARRAVFKNGRFRDMHVYVRLRS